MIQTILDQRERELELGRGMQTFIDSHLQAKGIEPIDGWQQRTCQTGEEYDVELTVMAHGIAKLTQATAGAVAAFGEPGCRCYWRTRADVEQRPGEGDRMSAYVRFRMTHKPEMSSLAKAG